MAKTLDNFSLYLWHNPEGYHVTVTTNYKQPTEQRSFFSFGGQTYKSWRQFNLSQPEPIRGYFAQFKEIYQPQIKHVKHNYWISKLALNTGTRGRRTAPGAMILQQSGDVYSFVLDLAGHTFEGDFDHRLLTERQRVGAKGTCVGAYVWQNDDNIQDYAEAF